MRISRPILKAVFIFIISYLLFLILWLQVKDYYALAITEVASRIVTVIKDVRLEYLTQKKDIIEVTFSPLRQNIRAFGDILIDIPVKTSSYTFNAPLTLSIMAGLYPFLRKRLRGYLEAILILIVVHLLYVSSLEAMELTGVFISRGIEQAKGLRVMFYEFLWGFTDNMVIRFEPFLIGFYLFIKYRTVSLLSKII